MAGSRDLILERIRGALAPLPERTAYPEYADDLPVCRVHPEFDSAWDLFTYRMKQVNGIAMEGPEAVAAYLKENQFTHGYVDSALAKKLPRAAYEGITIETTFDRDRVDDYQFGMTLASGAIAETGSLILKDRANPARLAALAPWVHIAVIHPDTLYPDFPSALAAQADDDPSIVIATGPSKTADVEGILIEGVHGPGVQIACLWKVK